MKFKKNYIATLVGLSIITASYAQEDLIRQVPENASFVFVINNPAIVKHSSFDKINEVLKKLGTFDNMGSQEVQIESITDLDLSYDRSVYIYKTDTDSSYYTGILLPLKTGHQVGTNLFSKLSPLPVAQGYERRVSIDGKTQVAWNEHSALILTGAAHQYYFDIDSVAQRYGIEPPDYSYNTSPAYGDYDYNDDYDYDYTSPDSTYGSTAEEIADDIYGLVDSAETAWQAHDFDSDTATSDFLEVPPPPIRVETEYADEFYFDAYSDSTYQKEIARHAKNDSLRNAAFTTWLAQDFDHYLYPTRNAASHKELSDFDKKNTLVHFWAKDFMWLYRQTLPYSMMGMSMQLGYNMENIFYTYKDIVIDLVQDKHTLKLHGSLGLHEDMERMIKPIYRNKMNRKFKRYIPEDHIGYFSLNINTEAYLKSFPQMLGHMYGGSSLYFAFGEVADIVATAFEIALDEKAIAKVMGGDHLLFINEMKKVQKEYVDYEYDADNFDYREIKKTKDDYVPTFLWMFTSRDQRIYEKILELGRFKEKVTQTDGIYSIIDNPSDDVIYALFKDDIVFVSNDKDQLTAIQTNQLRVSKDRSIRKQIYSNNMTAVTHLSEMPQTINKLGIPVITRWERALSNMAGYGDVTITAQGTKKGKITGEMAIDFPKQSANALQYLLQELLDTIE